MRDHAAVFDRPEGNAAPVVEHARPDERAGGTDPQARVAAAAALLEWLVRLERRGGDDFCEQDIRPRAGHEQVRVLAQPAETGACRRGPVEHPAVIDVGLRGVAPIVKHRDQRLHPLKQDLVIVVAEGVGGNAAAGAPTLPSHCRGGGRVRVRQGDHATGVRHRPARIRAGVGAGQIPPAESIEEALRRARRGSRFGLVKWLRTGHANGAKTQRPGPVLEGVRQRHLPLA